MINYKKIYKEIDKYEYVSFDIFDTLLCRKCNNQLSVFDFLEKEFNSYFNVNKNVFNARINAEIKARENSSKDEITYNEIYNFFDFDYSIEMIQWLKKTELQIEEDLLVLNNLVVPIYNYAKDNNKKIIIESDMYLDSSFIARLLKKNNIIYDKLYVSSEIEHVKWNGGMYKYVINDLGCAKKQIIHIGDSLRSDYIQPFKLGIRSIHISKIKLRTFDNSFENLCFLLFKKKLVNYEESYQLGYRYLGPLYVSFSTWLYQHLKQNGINKVLFLSRDGKIMKESFDLLYPNFDSSYFYLSRRSIVVPSLYLLDTFEEVLSILNLSALKNVSLKLIKEKMGIYDYDISKYESKYDFTDETIFDGTELINNISFKEFYYSIEHIIKENSKKEYYEFINYLSKYNIKGRVAIVDIGWQGTMQKALTLMTKKLGINVDFYGYYYGLLKNNVLNNEKSYGYIFNPDNYSNYIKLFSFGGLFEYFFSCDEGSVKKYSNGKPILEKNEYAGTKYLEILNSIQIGGIEFVKDVLSVKKYYSFNEKMFVFANDNLFKFGCNPKIKYMKIFYGLYYNNIENYYLLPHHSLFYYMFHLKEFKKDLNNSFWKIGFMKKVFKISLPYLKIYSWFKKK